MPANQIVFNTLENNLTICLRPDSIVYSVTDENEQVLLRQEINILPGKTANTAVYEHFFNQPELNVLSENVQIQIENSAYQLTPSELFREEHMSELFEIEFGKSVQDSLRFSLLPKWGMHLVYRVPSGMIDFFEKKYPDAVFTHHVWGLMKHKIDKSKSGMFVNLRKDSIDLFVVEGNMLQLANSFEVKTNEDICYFVLNTYENLLLDTESFTLTVWSKNTVNEELISRLNSYIVNVKTK